LGALSVGPSQSDVAPSGSRQAWTRCDAEGRSAVGGRDNRLERRQFMETSAKAHDVPGEKRLSKKALSILAILAVLIAIVFSVLYVFGERFGVPV